MLILAMAALGESRPVEVVSSVDLKRYEGTWYEIARFPNRFQRKCQGDTSATYTLRPDGKVNVVNRCREEDGSFNTATGTARVASAEGPNTKLKVTFFWPFSGDYWIIGLDPDYRWALVGDPQRKYLWVLNREPRMDDAEYQRVLGLARAQGFDVARLLLTKQGGA